KIFSGAKMSRPLPNCLRFIEANSRASNRMNKTAKNTKDAKEFTADFRLPWRTWRLGGLIC
ncbi:MAG TPA: hypothetical protein VGK58_18730, partial [Lacipirellulaceae bacterium]